MFSLSLVPLRPQRGSTVPCVDSEGASEGQEDKAQRLSLSCSHMANDGGWAK